MEPLLQNSENLLTLPIFSLHIMYTSCIFIYILQGILHKLYKYKYKYCKSVHTVLIVHLYFYYFYVIFYLSYFFIRFLISRLA